MNVELLRNSDVGPRDFATSQPIFNIILSKCKQYRLKHGILHVAVDEIVRSDSDRPPALAKSCHETIESVIETDFTDILLQHRDSGTGISAPREG